MTVEERMQALIAHGAVLSPASRNGSPLTIAGCLWLTEPTRWRWCAIFPQHQGHVHELHYTRVALVNGGRDILFYNGEELLCAVVPYEYGPIDPGEVRAALAQWRALLSKYTNAQKFEEFLAEA